MRVHAVLAGSLLPVALAAPYIPIGWTTVTKTVTWFSTGPSLPDQSIIDFADPSQTIYEILKSRDEFSKLVKVIDKEQEIFDLLNNKKRGLTFFAPNNEALDKLHDRGPRRKGLADDEDEIIKEHLYYHTLPNVIEYSRFGQNSTLATQLHAHDGTFGGHHRRLKIESSTVPWKVTINNYAVISESDIRAANGVIHKIDAPLLLPPDIMDALYLFPDEFSTTATALLKIDLQNEYEFNSGHQSKDRNSRNDRHGKGTGATTFFAPTNAAWNDLPRDLVFYLFSPWGERTLRKLMAWHTIPEALVYSEWVKDDDSTEEFATEDDSDLSFEWDHHFDSLIDQKLPVHSKKTKSILPGSHTYNIEFMGHGVPVRLYDNVAQNGALHVLDAVLCPRHKEGTDAAQNVKDWLEWKDWLHDWSNGVQESK